MADHNIHRDTFRDERLCLLIWVPREHARRFLDLASSLVDYRTVDLDVPPVPEETPPVQQERQQLVPRARHNLPMARLGRQFIGRDEEIARVQAMLLAAGSGAITDALALEGLGGIGKTRLAVEYAWNHLADYDWVYFLRADTPETLRHPEVATDLNNLAQLLQDTHRLEEAEPLMRRALAILEKILGAEHPSVATALNNLATLLQNTYRLEEAEPLMRRALAIDEQSYGPEHPKVAIRLNNLAGLLQV
ncbi:MAG: tetratricopeptide repeat protein, partial [Gammaproteobacteria bacterium]